MSTMVQRYVAIGLAGIWAVLMAVRVLSTEPPQEAPLKFVSGRTGAVSAGPAGASDPWHLISVTAQARAMSEAPKKNIFAPLGEPTDMTTTPLVAKRPKRVASPPPPAAPVAPLAPPGPTLEELAVQAARQQEELKHKQVREQMAQYRYLGYLSQQGIEKAFVGKGKDIYIIRKGDKLEGKFLVASIDPVSVKLKEPVTNLEASIDLKKEGEHGPS
jgi:hypothetical protein